MTFDRNIHLDHFRLDSKRTPITLSEGKAVNEVKGDDQVDVLPIIDESAPLHVTCARIIELPKLHRPRHCRLVRSSVTSEERICAPIARR